MYNLFIQCGGGCTGDSECEEYETYEECNPNENECSWDGIVINNIQDYALVVGNPAKQIGWVCECGEKLSNNLDCKKCNRQFIQSKIPPPEFVLVIVSWSFTRRKYFGQK